MRWLTWRRGTRTFVVGVTVVVIAIAAIVRQGGSTSSPGTPRPIPPTLCHVSTVLGTPMTICTER
jgi:hypothetical protein